jgi:hypothetical protein
MTRFPALLCLVAIWMLASACGCSQVVDFDRRLLVDASVDASLDASLDAGVDADTLAAE